MKALVLSGGGARGAYQAGVLKGISDIASKLKIQSPFQIYSGVSAGAINACYLASGAQDFSYTCQQLVQMWANLTPDKVFKTDAVSIGRLGLQIMGDLSLGSLMSNVAGKSLLDTEPLAELIKNNINGAQIQKNIDDKIIKALAVTAIDYGSTTTVTFVNGDNKCIDWARDRRKSEKVKINYSHVMASSAIPILFPPIQLGSRFFGDGCVRNFAPCSPAIHLGADKMLIVGVRNRNPIKEEEKTGPMTQNSPTLARVINVLLNTILLDGVEVDIERMQRINEFVSRVPENLRDKLNFKTLDYVFISPSKDIGHLASQLSHHLPRVIRYLLKGLGPIEDAKEIISYLLFEKDFCGELIEFGYEDAMASRDQIEAFLKS